MADRQDSIDDEDANPKRRKVGGDDDADDAKPAASNGGADADDAVAAAAPAEDMADAEEEDRNHKEEVKRRILFLFTKVGDWADGTGPEVIESNLQKLAPALHKDVTEQGETVAGIILDW